MSLVYWRISPPTKFFRPAMISLPMCRVRMVLPRTRPKVLTIFLPGMWLVVVTIIFSLP